MTNKRSILCLSILITLVAIVLQVRNTQPVTAAATASAAQPSAVEQPLLFIEGQDPQSGHARFQLHGSSQTIWLQDGAIWITIMPPPDEPINGIGSVHSSRPGASTADDAVGVNLRLSFPGANDNLQPEPFGPLSTRVNTLHGSNPDRWQTNQPAWSGVRYPELYPGIDFVLEGAAGHLRPTLVAARGADLAAVRLRVEGAETMTVDGDVLHLATAAGDHTMALFPIIRPDGAEIAALPAPRNRGQDIVEAPFARATPHSGATAPQQFDIFYATFLDGLSSSTSIGYGIAVEKTSGLSYVTGATSAADFPSTPGAFDFSHNGSMDVFVVQLASLGDTLGFATFVGGTGADWGYAVTLDQLGFVYVTGETESDDFPITAGAHDDSYDASGDAFILKLNPQGNTLAYSTYVGGAGSDVGWDIAVNNVGEAFVTGSTLSSMFPTTLGAYDTSYAGNRDAFVLRLNQAGSGLVYGTFLGGGSFDEGIDVVVDSTGFLATVTGSTESATYPTTTGAFDPDYNGGYDSFVTRLNGDGSGLSFSTFLGAANDDTAYALDTDGAGFFYISGQTASPDFPVTAAAYDSILDGSTDAFVVRLNPAGSTLAYATYLGGSGPEQKAYVAVDDLGMAYVTGATASPDFPVTPGGTGNRNCGGFDTYALRLSATGSSLAFGITMGGQSDDDPVRVALDNSNQATYYTGYTDSFDFPTTADAYDPTGNAWTSAIAVKMGLPGPWSGPVGPQGATLNFGDATYQFGAGTFTSDAVVVHVPLPDNPTLAICGGALSPAGPPTNEQIIVGEPFVVTAHFPDTGQIAEPSLPYTLTVTYTPADLDGAPEETLALYRWDGEQWISEHTGTLDPSANTVTATVTELGTWAILGEGRTSSLYLPLFTDSTLE